MLFNLSTKPIVLYRPSYPKGPFGSMDKIIVSAAGKLQYDWPDVFLNLGNRHEVDWMIGQVYYPGDWIWNGTSYMIHGGVASIKDIPHENVAS